jgi:hypothetical protein
LTAFVPAPTGAMMIAAMENNTEIVETLKKLKPSRNPAMLMERMFYVA